MRFVAATLAAAIAYATAITATAVVSPADAVAEAPQQMPGMAHVEMLDFASATLSDGAEVCLLLLLLVASSSRSRPLAR
jgi:hypothetical protein